MQRTCLSLGTPASETAALTLKLPWTNSLAQDVSLVILNRKVIPAPKDHGQGERVTFMVGFWEKPCMHANEAVGACVNHFEEGSSAAKHVR